MAKGNTKASEPSAMKLAVYVIGWYIFNSLYLVYNKKSTNVLNAGWFLTCIHYFVGMIWSLVLWSTGLRQTPQLSRGDLWACVPTGFFAAVGHAFAVLATGAGAVSFSQIIYSSEPVFASILGVLLPPVEIKPLPAYLMFGPIIGGVALACIKPNKGLQVNMAAATYASVANTSFAVRSKLGGKVTRALKLDATKRMDSSNVYAVMNFVSFFTILPVFLWVEYPTFRTTYETAIATHGTFAVLFPVLLSGFFYFTFNEFSFAFNSHVGAVTTSVLSTVKCVLAICVSSIVFREPVNRNTILGSAIAISGTMGYSYFAKRSTKTAATTTPTTPAPQTKTETKKTR